MSGKVSSKGRFIGRGKAARVYKMEGEDDNKARKEFAPIYPVKLWNWFFYRSPHPLQTEEGHDYAYWKRRLAHRLCKYLGDEMHIPDAVDRAEGGFISEYIEGKRPDRKDKKILRATVRKLESFFKYLGMPTWSFSRKNPFAGSNFLIRDGKVIIVDYEQSVPVPDVKGRLDYDNIYFDELTGFIDENEKRMKDKLGDEEMFHLRQALEMAQKCSKSLKMKPKNVTKFVNLRKKKQ